MLAFKEFAPLKFYHRNLALVTNFKQGSLLWTVAYPSTKIPSRTNDALSYFLLLAPDSSWWSFFSYNRSKTWNMDTCVHKWLECRPNFKTCYKKYKNGIVIFLNVQDNCSHYLCINNLHRSLLHFSYVQVTGGGKQNSKGFFYCFGVSYINFLQTIIEN